MRERTRYLGARTSGGEIREKEAAEERQGEGERDIYMGEDSRNSVAMFGNRPNIARQNLIFI